ncbi:MAG: hypothetical protein KKB13_18240, partial [Chloroflexi bacterium]|nr:hypothetical protein [Chloroflexota bacterium]
WGPWQQGGNTDNIRFYCTAAADGDVTYAGSSQGVYRSTDQGQTWHKRGLDGQGIPALLALPGTTQVYAGVSHGGVYYSSDGGSTWSARNVGLGSMDVTTLVARPGTPATLYAGLYGAPGVARSTDGGAHWQDWGAGLPGLPLILSLIADPTAPTTLYAGEAAAVYRSTDGGSTWNVRANSPLDWYDSLILDPQNTQILYGGQRGSWLGWPTGYRSADGGASWTTLPRGGSWVWGPAGLYCGTTEGVWYSQDQGSTWTEWNENLGNLNVRHLLYTATVFYAATDDGLWWRGPAGSRP